MSNRNKIIIEIIIYLAVIAAAIASLQYDYFNNKNCVTIISGLWSAVATAVLGGIAYWQNKRYKSLSDEYNDLAFMPEIYICTAFDDRISGMRKSLFTNVNGGLEEGIKSCCCTPVMLWFVKGPIINLKVKEIKHSKKTYPCYVSKIGTASFRDETIPFNLILFIPEETISADNLYSAILEYENIYGTRYQKELTFTVYSGSTTPHIVELKKARRAI